MDINALMDAPYVPREPCTCRRGLPECPACRAWHAGQGRFVPLDPEQPSPAELEDRAVLLRYIRDKITCEKRTERALQKRLTRCGTLSPEDRILLLETRAMLEVHRQQRQTILYPRTRGGRHGRKPLVAH